jgi:hypothetical protein
MKAKVPFKAQHDNNLVTYIIVFFQEKTIYQVEDAIIVNENVIKCQLLSIIVSIYKMSLFSLSNQLE